MWSILRSESLKDVGINLANLIFYWGGTHGQEIKDDDITLKAAALYNNVCIFITRGVPSKWNQKRLKFLIAEPIQQTHVLQDNQFYTMVPLLEIPVSTTTTWEIKQFIVAKVNEDPTNPYYQKLDPNLMRLWESTVDKITKVYLDEEYLERYSMYEGKEIAIQIL